MFHTRVSASRPVVPDRPVAIVTSTTYDRRALDIESDIPLINSLNHLTYLVSHSQNIREVVASDGALERLVSILSGCHLTMYQMLGESSTGKSRYDAPLRVTLDRNKAYCAWKWTLALQCLVLTGTRGTEAIRGSVVAAGVLPLLATILDNSLLYHHNYDFIGGRYLDINFKGVDLQSTKFYHYLRLNAGENYETYLRDILGSDTFHLQSDTSDIGEELLKPTSVAPSNFSDVWERMKVYQMDHSKELNFENCFLDPNGKYSPMHSPRTFHLGRVVPKEVDVLWTLQLLAFFSKYTYMKPKLQKIEFVESISFRAITDRIRQRISRKKGEPFPQTFFKSKYVEKEVFVEPLVELSLIDKDASLKLDNPKLVSSTSHFVEIPTTEVIETTSGRRKCQKEKSTDNADPFLRELQEVIKQAEKHEELQENQIVFGARTSAFDPSISMTDAIAMDERSEREKTLSKSLSESWNYRVISKELTSDMWDSIMATQYLNIFPLVEKYTVDSENSPDIAYWSSIIMRNFCKKDGVTGVRQCANSACGKWEEYSKQFAKCQRCKRAKYCSRKCQLNAWPFHKYWCHKGNIKIEAGNAKINSNGGYSPPASNRCNHQSPSMAAGIT